MSDTRRNALIWGAGALAAVAGAALGWRRWAPQAPVSGASAELWASVFRSPEGVDMPMKQLAGRPLLLNFWATWCPPCVEEMPMISNFFDANRRGVNVLGLAIDQAPAVQRFLKQTPVTYPIAMAGAAGLGLAKSLGNQGGGLPYSVFFDRNGAQMYAKVGKLSESDLADWLSKVA